MEISTQQLLRQVPIFSSLDDEAVRALAGHCRRRQFAADEALFHKGDPGYALYVIVSGRVAIQTSTPAGELVHLGVRGVGEPVGELSLIDGKPRMADAVTAEPCDLLVLDREGFLLAIEESPRIAISIMATLADRLRQAADKQESQQGLNILGRVSELLLCLLEAHGVPEPGGGKRIDARISQQEIADQVGASRESVNRALASLKSVGAIRSEKREIVVLSVARLKRFASK